MSFLEPFCVGRAAVVAGIHPTTVPPPVLPCPGRWCANAWSRTRPLCVAQGGHHWCRRQYEAAPHSRAAGHPRGEAGHCVQPHHRQLPREGTCSSAPSQHAPARPPACPHASPPAVLLGALHPCYAHLCRSAAPLAGPVLQAVAAEFGIAGATADWRSVVADPDIDAVVIGTWWVAGRDRSSASYDTVGSPPPGSPAPYPPNPEQTPPAVAVYLAAVCSTRLLWP